MKTCVGQVRPISRCSCLPLFYLTNIALFFFKQKFLCLQRGLQTFRTKGVGWSWEIRGEGIFASSPETAQRDTLTAEFFRNTAVV